MTPMLRQYFSIKEQHEGCLLLFRCGDFYETYGEDAVIASKEMEIVLTSKDAGEGRRIEMAGIPYFALEQYLHMLVGKGYKVALCDQVEDPKMSKGLVKREVVRIISSGTILEPEMLDTRSHNYLACLMRHRDSLAMALADISTGDFEVTQFPGDDEEILFEELDRWRPSEVIVDSLISGGGRLRDLVAREKLPFTALRELPDPLGAEEILKNHYGLRTLMGTGLVEQEGALCAAACLLQYLKETQKNTPLALRLPRYFSRSEYLSIDSTSKRNLELFQTIVARERKGTLLWAIDSTVTPMGARLLKAWLAQPLLKRGEIEKRLDAVQELMGNYDAAQAMARELKKVQDLERLLSKVVYGTCNGRDLLGISSSLEQVPHLKDRCAALRSELFSRLTIDPLADLRFHLERSIEPSAPATLREGNLIREGFHQELDELRQMRKSAKEWIARYEEKERDRTGIRSLKVGFNQVFGYYIEVTRANLKSVPEDYIRKQTIANGERFFSPDLKEYETKVLSADERIKSLEYEIFQEIRGVVAGSASRLQELSRALALADVLISFASTAVLNHYTRPVIEENCVLDIKDGRHPVIEQISGEPFVKNDVYMDDQERLIIITGPNMSGKSTYLRQIALITILAQMGSFVPASMARIGIVDKIFTRVGATDDLHLGQSTFMVEMLETANILNNATDRSLIILDEIGRGTSTYDGLSIAWAVAEFLYGTIRGKTLFATHFHELTSLSRLHEGIKNKRVAVKETGDEVIFLHKILPGSSDKSYGIYVAKLAGFPAEILERASEKLEDLENEKKGIGRFSGKSPSCAAAPEQLTFFEDAHHPILDEIRKLSIMEITPLEALNRIYKWQKSIERFKSRN
jgi:DNA mismatch repair protein MutS